MFEEYEATEKFPVKYHNGAFRIDIEETKVEIFNSLMFEIRNNVWAPLSNFR